MFFYRCRPIQKNGCMQNGVIPSIKYIPLTLDHKEVKWAI